MFDIFHLFDIALLIVLAVLIYRNKDWKYQPIFIVCFVMLVITVFLTIIYK